MEEKRFIAVTYTEDEATAVKTALKHVWREVFDRGDEYDEEDNLISSEPTGEALHLLTALAKLDPTYEVYLPRRFRRFG